MTSTGAGKILYTKPHASGVGADPKIAETITVILERAVAADASDIHFEPREQSVLVRFRIDGWLHQATKLPLAQYPAMTRELKKRAGLSASKTKTPQSGRTAFDSERIYTTLTISTIPTINGEKVEIHITPHLSDPAGLKSLGFWGAALANIEQTVAEPHGMILASGPDKLGTTMTMLGIIHLLNNPGLDIATLESPILQHIASINQVEASAASGASFSDQLQTLLRQDPNIIMISSLADKQTATLSITTALSGRLLLASTHQESAAQAIEHLLHMHIEPFLAASALRLSVAQRFVRRLCPECREAYLPTPAEREQLRAMLRASGIRTVRKLHELELSAAQAGLSQSAEGVPMPLSTTESHITRLWRASRHGCEHCNFTRYHGRIGICEVLPVDEPLQRLVAQEAGTQDLHRAGLQAGMIPLQLDGFIKALRGLTSLQEILALAASMARKP